jgi:hypothetical protein
VDLVIIEDTSSGMGLIQLLREEPGLNGRCRHPDADKVTRMSRQQGRFEAGRILLPNEAPWLADFETSPSRSLMAATTTRSTRYCCSSIGMRKTSGISAHGVLPTDHHRSPEHPLSVGTYTAVERLVNAVSGRIRRDP